jgi:hypothetical protein
VPVLQVKEKLKEYSALDVDPLLTEGARCMRERMGKAGYKHLLSVGEQKPVFRPLPTAALKC